MSNWQPIETAPMHITVLAWYEGTEDHHGRLWHRCGYGFHFRNSNGFSQRLADEAIKQICGPGAIVAMRATKWQPLPEPPELSDE